MIDPSKIEAALASAASVEQSAISTLKDALGRIGVVPGWTGQNPHNDLQMAISTYVQAAAKLQLLLLIKDTDLFYAGLMRSAANTPEVKEP